jgi:predicted alpha/beta-fold hydrolase
MGYKVVLMCHRGTCKVKLTSPKLYDCTSVEDIEDMTNYVWGKYAKKQGRNLHGYAVSLGANIFNLYLMQEGKKCVYTSLATQGNLWDMEYSMPYY